VTEPAADVPLAIALVSALSEEPVRPAAVSFGEVGLTGRVRPVAHAEARIREAARQGFDTAIAQASGVSVPAAVRLAEVDSLAEALEVGLAT
jgi:DNA repair protein RadA/Sms